MDGWINGRKDIKKIFLTEPSTQIYVALYTNFNLQVISYLLVGAGKENERSWFQNGSFSETDSVPDNFFKYSFLGRSPILLLFDPIF